MRLFRDKLNRIDLLPESVQIRKLHRKRIIKLAALQAAILLCLGLAIVAANALEGQAWEESHCLAVRINNLRQYQATAETIDARDINRRILAAEAFIEANAPTEFNPEWLATVLSADHGYMTTMDYSRGFILLAGAVDNINKIEIHRQNLLDAEIFVYVRMGRVSLQDEGTFYYELRLEIP